MNKIIIDTRVFDLTIKEDCVYEIDNLNNNSDISINILENVKATINLLIKTSQVNITIKLHENSNLVVNQLGINSSININSYLSSLSNLRYVDSILSSVDSINNIEIVQRGESSKCVFFANGINLSNNKFFFTINGIIEKNSLNVYLEENSKIINIMNGNSKIIPNLLVDNKDVVANHSAFIGTFNNEDIWYLNSRGIETIEAWYLLLKATLFGNMESFDRFLDAINQEKIFLDEKRGVGI